MLTSVNNYFNSITMTTTLKKTTAILSAIILALAITAAGWLKGINTVHTPVHILVLHTNDTHSQVEPIAQGSKNANKGGYARRMGLIEQYRQQAPELLLLDAGDFSQGTPYFNYFNGRVEVDALNRMYYDVVTLGNHEFDNGTDTLAAILSRAEFKVVCANYDVKNTPLENIVKPYVILHRKGVKIGIFGLGVQPDGLITPQNFAPLKWNDPLPIANELANNLRNKQHCDLVICLSHLGTDPKDSYICDNWLAENTSNIDIIIGSHTHKLVVNRHTTNLQGHDVLLTQMGKSGVNLGIIHITLQ